MHGGKRKNAGRPKGAANKATQDVIEKLSKLGCDPIEGMARIAEDDKQDIALRASMYKELAQYVAPKRKAIEQTNSHDGELIINVNHIGE